jgi:hypothetical protein
MKQGDILEKKYTGGRVTAFAVTDKDYTATITLSYTLNVETKMELERLLSYDLEFLALNMREDRVKKFT